MMLVLAGVESNFQVATLPPLTPSQLSLISLFFSIMRTIWLVFLGEIVQREGFVLLSFIGAPSRFNVIY